MAYQFSVLGIKRVYAGNGNAPEPKEARHPDPVMQSWITHYLFGNSGIISVLMPYLVFNANRYANYGANLLRACSFVLNCGGGELRAVANAAALRSFIAVDQQTRKYSMLQTLRWYTCGMRSCLDNNPNLIEGWPDMHVRGMAVPVRFADIQWTVRGIHLSSENLLPHHGMYMQPVGVTSDGEWCAEWDPRYHRWYTMRPTSAATRYRMERDAGDRPELFDCTLNRLRFSKTYDLVEPRMLRREPWTGCKDKECGVCFPKAGKGWVYVD